MSNVNLFDIKKKAIRRTIYNSKYDLNRILSEIKLVLFGCEEFYEIFPNKNGNDLSYFVLSESDMLVFWFIFNDNKMLDDLGDGLMVEFRKWLLEKFENEKEK